MTLPSKICIYFILVFSLLFSGDGFGITEKEFLSRAPVSPQTQVCIGCHKMYTPGIVQDWLSSRHSKITPGEASEFSPLERRLSTYKPPEAYKDFSVGCYECHSQNTDNHKDSFEHMGYKINVIVTPNDCKTCHPAEVKQFSGSKKANAHKNLMGNPLYHMLTDAVTGMKKMEGGKISGLKPSEQTLHDTCLGCHGTRVEVKGLKNVPTQIGWIRVPDLSNWPNQGVGRENPDGSLGACTSCHPRHGFSIEVARKPYTCGQCHYEPDVPAYNVYMESKHGNIYSSTNAKWDFSAVPWAIGRDFKTPTCAACHNSLIISPANEAVIAERTHDFGSRLWVRIFGLIYSHPQPKSGDTTLIKNYDDQPLPVTFSGRPASNYLIDSVEQDRRAGIMKGICNGCHSTVWFTAHFEKFDNTVKETDAMTQAATELMSDAWANRIEDRNNPFDEPIEQLWVSQWLFYANTVRFTSAMAGSPDFTSFKNGWWDLNINLQRMKEMIELRKKAKGTKTK